MPPVHTFRRDSRFFGIFMRFSGFLFTFLPTTYLYIYICVYLLNITTLSAGSLGSVSYAIKPTGLIKTQLNFLFFFFSFLQFFPRPLAFTLRSVICDRFLLIFRIRKTVFPMPRPLYSVSSSIAVVFMFFDDGGGGRVVI